MGLELDKRCFWFAWGVLARFRVGLVFGVGLGLVWACLAGLNSFRDIQGWQGLAGWA